MNGNLALAEVTEDRLEAELVRRSRARDSLIEYSRAIEIPGKPVVEDDPLSIFQPIESEVVKHHRIVMREIQETMETPNGRLMIIAPPGSAKSTYACTVATTWALGKWPGYRLLMTSYAQDLIRKHSRRARQVCMSRLYRTIWPELPVLRADYGSVDAWALSNGSELMASGILGGLTGNRANGVIGDDLIAGRDEADSVTIRDKTWDAWQDDAETRLLPNGWMILINTRWHEDDISGRILPDNYDGRSGMVKGKDGRDWCIVNMPARCERTDDPVGRRPGEYLWPEWFPPSHWKGFELNPRGQRRWSALYQGRPTADSGDSFKREWFKFYNRSELPRDPRTGELRLEIYGASDFAVTDPDKAKTKKGRSNDDPDFTEHGVVGIDDGGEWWVLAWWADQVETDVGVEAFLQLVAEYKPRRWWDEGGVIDKAVRPWIRKAMRPQQARGKYPATKARYVHLEALPKIADKRAKCASFQATASARIVHFPLDSEHSERVIAQLTGFPGARYDDAYDVCGLLGRGIDKMMDAEKPKAEKEKGLRPFTEEWLMYQERSGKQRDV